MHNEGNLGPVRNFVRNVSSISWDSPTSLDLTNISPDIAYCLEVYNITCGVRDLLLNDCNLFEDYYTNSIFDPAYIYEINITPRSNIDGAENGTTVTVNGNNYHARKYL